MRKSAASLGVVVFLGLASRAAIGAPEPVVKVVPRPAQPPRVGAPTVGPKSDGAPRTLTAQELRAAIARVRVHAGIGPKPGLPADPAPPPPPAPVATFNPMVPYSATAQATFSGVSFYFVRMPWASQGLTGSIRMGSSKDTACPKNNWSCDQDKGSLMAAFPGLTAGRFYMLDCAATSGAAGNFYATVPGLTTEETVQLNSGHLLLAFSATGNSYEDVLNLRFGSSSSTWWEFYSCDLHSVM